MPASPNSAPSCACRRCPRPTAALAQAASERDTPYAVFLEEVGRAEREARRTRAREMFARVAGSGGEDAEGYDCTASPPERRGRRSRNWPAWPSWSGRRTWCFLGPSGVGKTHLAAIALGTWRRSGMKVRFHQCGGPGPDAGDGAAPGAPEGGDAPAVNLYRLLIVDEIGYLPFAREPGEPVFRWRPSATSGRADPDPPNLSFWGVGPGVCGRRGADGGMLDRVLHHASRGDDTGESYG